MTMTQAELARRIQAAREAAGLTQAKVAVALGMSRPTVAQIEAGRRSVTGLELERLAHLFGRDLRDFFRDDFQEADGLAALFRAEPAIAQEDSLAEALRHGLRVGRELSSLEELLGVPGRAAAVAAYELPLPRTRWEAIVQGDRTAEEERRRLGLGTAPIENLATLLESQGIRTAWVEMDEEISGLTLRDRQVGFLVVVNSRHHWLRRRFSYAHEYAHVLLDHDRLGVVSKTSDRTDLREVRANAFAAAFLMPAEGVLAFLASLGKGFPSRPRMEVFDEAEALAVEGREEPGNQEVQLHDVILLAHHFGVSRMAALYRLKNLKLIGDAEFETLRGLDEQDVGSRFAELLGLKDPDPTARRSEFKRRFLGLALEAYRRSLISRGKLRELFELLEFSTEDLDAALAEAGMEHEGATTSWGDREATDVPSPGGFLEAWEGSGEREGEDLHWNTNATASDLPESRVKKGGDVMAKNAPPDDGRRIGAVRERSQTFNPHNQRWVKRDATTGQFIDQKADHKPFKGVRREK